MRSIGVLGLQGDFDAHRKALEEVGARAVVVRRPAELEPLAGVILPGGESTTLLKLSQDVGMDTALRAFHASGRSIFGTCAGAILIAARVTGPRQPSLALIDIEIERNAYGRQRDSFETAEARFEPTDDPLMESMGDSALEVVLIRAPRIRWCGPGVEVLARRAGEPVLVRQGAVLAGTFHPEMGRDRRIHRLFVSMAFSMGPLPVS